MNNIYYESKGKAIITYDLDVYNVQSIKAVAHYMIGKCKTQISINKVNCTKIDIVLISELENVEKLVDEFNEELINYSFYEESMQQKGRLREILLERIIETVS